jgi:hypothetical protein
MSRNESVLANHEAGHAIASAFLGIPFESVSLATQFEYLSYIKKNLGPKYVTGFRLNEPDEDDEYFAAKERVKRACVALLAGPLSEKQHSIEEEVGGESDNVIADRIAILMTGDSKAATDYLKEREGEARLVIGTFSDQIDRVAAALLEGQTIPRASIREMMNLG